MMMLPASAKGVRISSAWESTSWAIRTPSGRAGMLMPARGICALLGEAPLMADDFEGGPGTSNCKVTILGGI